MEFNWLYTFLAIDGVILVAIGLIVITVRRSRREWKAEYERSTLQIDEIRVSMQALGEAMAEIGQSATNAEPETRRFIPAPVVTADQRAGALEMLRHGAGAIAVSTALRFPQPEAALLQKVQRLLDPASSRA